MRPNVIWTLAITSIALFMVVLDNLVVSTALPVIRVDLGATIEQLEWTVNAYTLTFAAFLLGVAVLASLFSSTGSYATPETFVDGFGPAMTVGAVVVALGAVAALAVPARRERAVVSPRPEPATATATAT